MISYHAAPPPPREKKNEAAHIFTRGFRTVDTNDPERIARGLTTTVVAPGIFKDGHRHEKNWLYSDWICLDFDDGEMTVRQAVENVFCDWTHIIGVTMSHQLGPAPRDKFRVLIPLEHRIDELSLYRHQLATAMKRWPCDPQCKDGARFFYPCREVVSVNIGEPWEINIDVPPEPKHVARSAVRASNHVIAPWALHALKTPWPERTRNNTCYRIGAALGIHGFPVSDIVAFILKSPTYAGKSLPKTLTDEISRAVENGVNRALRDLANV